jgi:hypothetical protein
MEVLPPPPPPPPSPWRRVLRESQQRKSISFADRFLCDLAVCVRPSEASACPKSNRAPRGGGLATRVSSLHTSAGHVHMHSSQEAAPLRRGRRSPALEILTKAGKFATRSLSGPRRWRPCRAAMTALGSEPNAGGLLTVPGEPSPGVSSDC